MTSLPKEAGQLTTLAAQLVTVYTVVEYAVDVTKSLAGRLTEELEKEWTAPEELGVGRGSEVKDDTAWIPGTVDVAAGVPGAEVVAAVTVPINEGLADSEMVVSLAIEVVPTMAEPPLVMVMKAPDADAEARLPSQHWVKVGESKSVVETVGTAPKVL
jgi:hypothetical protein